MMTLTEIYESMKLTNAEHDMKARTEDELIDYLNSKCDADVYFQIGKEDGVNHGYTRVSDGVHILVVMTPNYFVLAHEIAHILDDRKGTNVHDKEFMRLWREVLR